MFWKYNTLSVSHLDTLLGKQDVTLTEVLNEEDIIQECKSQNKKLVDFLTKPEILSELLDLILQEPPLDLEEKLRYKLPNIASELITCEVPQINEKLSSDTNLLDKMYNFLDNEEPLNPLLTSFFSKAFSVLITRRTEQNWYSYQYTCLQVVQWIKNKTGLIGLLVRHIATSAVMDLLFRLITCVEGPETRLTLLTWLNEEQLIQRILTVLGSRALEPSVLAGGCDPVVISEAHDNAGHLLVELIRASRDNQVSATLTERFDNPLLATAESEETVQTILNYMLDSEPQESTIIHGVGVLMSLLEVRRPVPQTTGYYAQSAYTTEQDLVLNEADIERQQNVLERTVETLIPRIPDLANLLVSPPAKPAISTSAGVLDPPLGATRLAVCKLFSTLLATNHLPLNQKMAEAGVFEILLDLFFKYNLNNFLHSQVESCIHHTLFWRAPIPNSEDTTTEEKAESESLSTPKISTETEHPLEKAELVENPLLVSLISSARLVEKVVDKWEENDQSTTGRKGYMGHLTRIANHIVSASSLPEDETVQSSDSRQILLHELDKLPEEVLTRWRELSAGKLVERNKLNEIKPTTDDSRTLSSDEEDFKDINFPQDSALQQRFSDYQLQQMSDNFVDSFGFNDEEFTESEENVGGGSRKLTGVNLSVEEQQQMFETVCQERINAFRSSPTLDENDEDPWADKTAEISFGSGVGQSPVKKPPSDDNSDSDDDSDSAPTRMEVDDKESMLAWETLETGSAAAPIAMDTSPWGEASAGQGQSAAAGTDTGWADFGAFSSAGGEGFANFSAFADNQEKMEENGDKKEGWNPARSSSPEPTMLDEQSGTSSARQTQPVDMRPPSPMIVQEEKRSSGSLDLSDSDSNANPSADDKVDDDVFEDSEGEENSSLTDNFSFLSSKGLLTAPESSENRSEESSVQPCVEANGPA